MEMALGVLVVAAAGLVMGSGAWPMKLMRTFQFEHWWLLASLTGLIIMPWTITLVAFPHVFEAYRDVPVSTLIASNLFAMSWGVANVLCGLCYVRIGVGLTASDSHGTGGLRGRDAADDLQRVRPVQGRPRYDIAGRIDRARRASA